jgi:histidinol dehydrogenase
MTSIDILRLRQHDADFDDRLDKLLAWDASYDQAIHQRVIDIIQQVRVKGDAALVELTNLYDQRSTSSIAELELSRSDLQNAWQSLTIQEADALTAAADRIRAYAEHQRLESWQYQENDGSILGQKVSPLDRVGVYVPGGKAAYPSSVLMNVIPAKVAGVPEIMMVVPMPRGEANSLVLAAAHLAGVDRVFCIGGAQAVAALAYGTESVPKVDKIVGPGNIYVATAKKLVFGQCGIDMIAGPSEILVVTDGKTNPDWLAMDLFSQAEHDENAQAILIGTSESHLDRVMNSMEILLPTMERQDVIKTALSKRGALILVDDLKAATTLINRIAPEHLELSVDEPQALLGDIRNAGAIFLGRFTAEALGDYCAGPNHVLPTGGTARFSSPLGVYDFQKRSSVIHCSAIGSSTLGRIASVLARGEGLTAHARSAEYRAATERD